MTRHILVEDTHSFESAGAPDGRIWSPSPGCRQALAGRRPVRSPELLIDRRTFDRFTRDLLDARPAIAAALGAEEGRDGGLAHLRATHGTQTYFLFLTVATKALLLDRWLAEVAGEPCRIVGCADLAPPRGLSVQVAVHDHVFAALAERLPSTGDGGPELVRVPRVDPSKFTRMFHHVPAFDRFFNVANRTVGATAYQAARRLFRRIGSGRGRGTILLLSDNEGIEESFLPLIARGWRIVRHEPEEPEAAPAAGGELRELFGALEPAWRAAVGPHLSSETADAGWHLVRERMSKALARHPAYLAAFRRDAIAARDRHGGGRPLIALGNGMYSPAMRLLDCCLREAGIPVVCADHGTSLGLVARLDPVADCAISFSDIYLAFNEESKRVYEANRRSPSQAVHNVGTPRIHSYCRFPRIQRAVVRRRLGVDRRGAVLMYVASLFANNLPQGHHTTTDAVYAALQKRIVEGLGAFPGRVVVKPYPVFRYADPDPVWSMPLPPNAAVAPLGEFRQLRWGADVLLLDLSSSTISWAVGCDRPLIYVANPTNALTREAAEAFRRAFFFVDSETPDWEEKLRALVATPLPELRARWREKAAERAEVSERFILGRRGGFASGLVSVLDELSAAGRSLKVPAERTRVDIP